MKIIGDRLDTILEWSKFSVVVDFDRKDAATNRSGMRPKYTTREEALRKSNGCRNGEENKVYVFSILT